LDTYICKICGNACMFGGKPTNCPSCGALSKYLLDPKSYKVPVVKSLNQRTGDNIVDCIKLLVNLSQFYLASAKVSKDQSFKARFRMLGRMEAEHVRVLSDLIGAQPPTIEEDFAVPKKHDSENEKSAAEQRKQVEALYRKALSEATELRTKDIFYAFIEFETSNNRK
jgi:rubrerythrin